MKEAAFWSIFDFVKRVFGERRQSNPGPTIASMRVPGRFYLLSQICCIVFETAIRSRAYSAPRLEATSPS